MRYHDPADTKRRLSRGALITFSIAALDGLSGQRDNRFWFLIILSLAFLTALLAMLVGERLYGPTKRD
jgi:hypothetical protein